MQIRGQFRTFGFWLSVISVVGGIILFYYLVRTEFYNMAIPGVLFILLALIILFGTFGRLLYDANLVLIDTDNQTITFTNQLTRKKATYKFSDFDGRLICFEPIKGGYARNLYLIRDKKAVKKITDFMYSNHRELEESLHQIADLGTIKYSYMKSWKISLGIPILD